MNKKSLKSVLIHSFQNRNTSESNKSNLYDLSSDIDWLSKKIPKLTSWNQMKKNRIHAKFLYKNKMGLHHFSHLTPKFTNLTDLVTYLNIKPCHLIGKTFFDPSEVIDQLIDCSYSQRYENFKKKENTFIKQLDEGLRITYNKKSDKEHKKYRLLNYFDEHGKIKKAKKRNWFLKAKDFVDFGWTGDDLIEMQLDHTYLNEIGLDNIKKYDIMTDKCNISDDQWDCIGLTEDKKEFLLY